MWGKATVTYANLGERTSLFCITSRCEYYAGTKYRQACGVGFYHGFYLYKNKRQEVLNGLKRNKKNASTPLIVAIVMADRSARLKPTSLSLVIPIIGISVVCLSIQGGRNVFRTEKIVVYSSRAYSSPRTRFCVWESRTCLLASCLVWCWS